MMVDPGEAQILERGSLELIEDVAKRGLAPLESL
jgi:hypothetical protein